MRVKEIILWYNGIKQHPKKYRSYETKECIRAGSILEVLKYVINGKRCGLNTKEFDVNGGIQYKGEGGFYFGFIKNDEYVEIKAWMHQDVKRHNKGLIKKHRKAWREDLHLWEKRYTFLIFNWATYSIWKDGKTINKFRLFPKRNAIRSYKPFTTDVFIEWDEWVNEYKKNKYLVPVNYKIPEDFL